MRPRGAKSISAMVRVKNEEEWLYQSVRSIVNEVDEVVLIDNLSTDATPDIIRRLVAEHPGKVTAFAYPHTIARQGREHIELAASKEGRRSPRLLPNFYNWCMGQCTKAYILKWDGDMIATPEFHDALLAFRNARQQVLWFPGLNVHPSRECAVKDVPPPLTPQPGMQGRIPSIADSEPRLFWRRFAAYSSHWFCEGLSSPYDQPPFRLVWPDPAYLHMALCRTVPFGNSSPNGETHAALLASVVPGEPLKPSHLGALARWQGAVTGR
jgi:glycosyltransferase involved in cell wall biosynthesis